MSQTFRSPPPPTCHPPGSSSSISPPPPTCRRPGSSSSVSPPPSGSHRPRFSVSPPPPTCRRPRRSSSISPPPSGYHRPRFSISPPPPTCRRPRSSSSISPPPSGSHRPRFSVSPPPTTCCRPGRSSSISPPPDSRLPGSSTLPAAASRHPRRDLSDSGILTTAPPCDIGVVAFADSRITTTDPEGTKHLNINDKGVKVHPISNKIYCFLSGEVTNGLYLAKEMRRIVSAIETSRQKEVHLPDAEAFGTMRMQFHIFIEISSHHHP